jgi:5-hydroxyisourate hydrolase
MARGISVHCFDIARGVVADGLRVAVYACEPATRLICEGCAGSNALLSHAALDARFAPGAYEIAFHVADYYRMAEVSLPAVPYLDVVRFRFNIDDGDTHYHFPLKVTPWGYSLFVTTSR